MHAAAPIASPLDPSTRSKAWPWMVGSLGLVAAHFPMLASGFRRIHGDPGDARFVAYLLEHSLRWLLRAPGHADFWSPPFFFPARNVAAYSETMLGVAPLYWLSRLAPVAPDTAFQIWTLIVSVLNFAAAYALLRRCLRGGAFPASVGAWVIAFGAPRVNQLNHPQLWAVFPSLGALWGLAVLIGPESRSLSPGRARGALALCCACSVLQLYASFYVGWFFALGLLLALAWALAVPSFRIRLGALLRSHGVFAAICAGLAALALVPMLRPYLQAAELVGPRPFT
ncbi:MAG TPA: hypothetical protein VEY30_01675, partial [Myxococcaceae bacterium]|nr:hypothetical protein [Myxococcaceae bacterium]